MLSVGLNPDDHRDKWVYYTAKFMGLKAREH
jgi:hypothetical protein